MEFNINHPILFVLVALIVAAVMGQSVFFLVKAWKRGRELGMERAKLRKIATTAAIFTIAPAVAIVISVIALSKKLGLPLPWLRLSVVGSLSYEAIAAENTSNAMGLTGSAAPNASQYVTIALVMTLSIMVGIWLVPVLCKKMQKGLGNLEKRDAKWADVFQSALFIGMISAFVGFVFCDLGRLWSGNEQGLVEVIKKVTKDGIKTEELHYYTNTSGLVPVCVMAVSALVMIGLGLLSKKFKKAHWIADYALPVSLLIGMACAIPFTAIFGGEVQI